LALLSATLAILASLVRIHSLHTLEQVVSVRALHIGPAGTGFVAFLLQRICGAGWPGCAIVINAWHDFTLTSMTGMPVAITICYFSPLR